MKEKVLASLKTRYSNLGFGEKAFDGVADFLSKTITEESQIEEQVGGVETLLKAFQGDVDKVRGEKSTLQKQLDELKASSEKPKDEDKKEVKEEVPEWAKALEERNKALEESLQKLTQGSISKTRAEKLELALKDVPEGFAKITKNSFELIKNADEEAFGNWIAAVETTAQEEIVKSASYVPGGGSATSKTDTPSSADVEGAYKFLKGE